MPAVIENRNRRTGLIALGVALAMLGLGYASVPLYRLFCQVTGFGGTTMKISEAEAAQMQTTTRTVVVRFDANVDRSMPWDFKPVQVRDTVAIGARDMVIYTARNTSSEPVTGTATFNVVPVTAGKYFSKVQCFCFTEQTLAPGQEVRMPVIFYVDPRIMDDPLARDLEEITLSYTFHAIPDDRAKALDRLPSGG